MKKILFLFLMIMLPAFAYAQVVQVKGVGSTTYTSGWLGGISQEDKDKAYRAAQVAAVERYFAESGESESENFEAIQEKIEADLEKFILSTSVINEQEQSNRYSVSVRIELNVAKLRNTLRGSSSVKKADDTEKSQLVFVFVGRETSSIKSFDTRVVKRAEIDQKMEESVAGHESESISNTSVSTKTSQSVSAKSSVKTESGGSKTRKADDTSYRLLSMNNVKTSITSEFSKGGFIVVEPEFVLDDKQFDMLNSDFSKGGDITAPTIRSIATTLKQSNIPYFVTATLDVGLPSQDSATGMQRVAVTVSAVVRSLTSSFPREVASVPAVQYFGVGPDNASAMTKGLKDASLAAAREIVSRLNAASVQ